MWNVRHPGSIFWNWMFNIMSEKIGHNFFYRISVNIWMNWILLCKELKYCNICLKDTLIKLSTPGFRKSYLWTCQAKRIHATSLRREHHLLKLPLPTVCSRFRSSPSVSRLPADLQNILLVSSQGRIIIKLQFSTSHLTFPICQVDQVSNCSKLADSSTSDPMLLKYSGSSD